MQPPKDASIGQAEGERAWPLSRRLQSGLWERIAGKDGDSNHGKSTPHLGRRDDGAVGERAAWESQEEAANSKSPLGPLPTSACLFLFLLGLVSSTREQFLTRSSLAGAWNIQTQL